ncbi:hypothetical protein H106_02244 [Trichophyton rubrum CBS 735.88]|nr:hypothetical protein H106_02244 [Trichophyton rubrum CBS 735.88]
MAVKHARANSPHEKKADCSWRRRRNNKKKKRSVLPYACRAAHRTCNRCGWKGSSSQLALGVSAALLSCSHALHPLGLRRLSSEKDIVAASQTIGLGSGGGGTNLEQGQRWLELPKIQNRRAKRQTKQKERDGEREKREENRRGGRMQQLAKVEGPGQGLSALSILSINLSRLLACLWRRPRQRPLPAPNDSHQSHRQQQQQQ